MKPIAAAATVLLAAATAVDALTFAFLAPMLDSLPAFTARGRGGHQRRLARAAAPPAFPDACNITNDVDENSYAAELNFEGSNNGCIKTFETCLQNLGASTCQSSCTTDIDLLQNGCMDTYCEVKGDSSTPSSSSIPAFSFRTAVCYPEGCDASTHDAMQSWWQYRLCGSTLFNTPDCQSISLECAYDLSDNTMWIIVGAVVGGFLVITFGLCVWWWCTRKPVRGDLDDDELFEDGSGGGGGGFYEEVYADPGGPGAYVTVPTVAYATYAVRDAGGDPAADADINHGPRTVPPVAPNPVSNPAYTYAVRTPTAGRATIATIAGTQAGSPAGRVEGDRSALLEQDIADARRPVADTRENRRLHTQDAIMSADEDRL